MSIVYVGFAIIARPFVVGEMRRTVTPSMICYGMYFANLVAKFRAGYRTSTCLLEVVVQRGGTIVMCPHQCRCKWYLTSCTLGIIMCPCCKSLHSVCYV